MPNKIRTFVDINVQNLQQKVQLLSIRNHTFEVCLLNRLGDFPVGNLTNEFDRDRWVQQQVDLIKTYSYDGINVDFEAPISRDNQTVRDGLSLLMWELYTSLKAINPHYQVSREGFI